MQQNYVYSDLGLHYSDGGDFSSLQVSDEYKDIAEGDVLVYNFTNNAFNMVDKFELNMSPFFL